MTVIDKVKHVFVSDENDPRLARNISDHIADEFKALADKYSLSVFACAYITKNNEGRFISSGHPTSVIPILKGMIDNEMIDSPNGMET